MIRRPVTSIAVTLLLGALLAGCGSSSTTSTSTSSPASSTGTTGSTSTGTSTPASPSKAATGSTSTKAPAVSAAQAVEACKHQVQAASALPASSKSKLEALCSTATTGQNTAVKKAAREICEEAVNKSKLPALAKEPALAACRNRTK